MENLVDEAALDNAGRAPMTIAAHRGAMAHAPENSLQSYALAESMGADEIELDVRMTSDGVLVVSHDATLDRIACDEQGRGLAEISELTMSQLAEVPLTSGRSVLTLEESFAATSITIQVEVKAPGCVVALSEFLHAHPNYLERTLFTSFRAQPLRELKRLLPEVPRGIIVKKYPVEETFPEGLMALLESTGSSIFHCGWDGLTKDVVETLHSAGYGVRGWPMRERADMERAVAIGVDGTTSDDPQLARSWYEEVATA